MQGVVGIDERLDGLLQPLIVCRDRDVGSAAGGADTGQLERHATDGAVDGVLRAGDLQAIDGQLGILSQLGDVTGTRAGHLGSAVDFQLRNTAERNVRASTSGGG
ncbi:hypothetical protein D3C76_1261550 [compost metagenome]